MRHFFNSLIFTAALIGASQLAQAEYRPGYYDKMDGKSKEALKAAAKECVSSHTRLGYTDLPDYWIYTDIYPDLVNGSRRWWDMYSNNIYLISGNQTPRSSFSANRMQREHSIPKSWWKKNNDVEYTPAYTDLWNLYPSDGPANQAKSNYPFGLTDNPSYNNGLTKVGSPKTGYGGGAGKVFEPGDEYKGDFARSIFYIATVYDDLDWVYGYMFRTQTWPTLQPWAMDMLLQWARQDLVSQKEIDRNEGVESQQGNRNPFIDFPELAEYIWGTRTTEVFRISEQGGNVTPPISGDPELIRPENGIELAFGQVAVTQTATRPLEIVASNLTAPLSLRISGSDRAQFSLESNTISAADLNNSDVYHLNVYYNPKTTGNHSATLSLYDGGLAPDKGVAITLRGQAMAIPTLTKLEALPASDISDTGYTANWVAAPQTVDYYVITRVQYTADGPQASTIISDTNSAEISDRDVAIDESYTVQSSRLGYLSEPSNSIMVSAGSSVAGIMKSQPLTLAPVEGGFTLIVDQPQTNLRVFDLTGRCLLFKESAAGGETIMLPFGVYIVTTDQNPAPLKTVVY